MAPPLLGRRGPSPPADADSAPPPTRPRGTAGRARARAAAPSALRRWTPAESRLPAACRRRAGSCPGRGSAERHGRGPERSSAAVRPRRPGPARERPRSWPSHTAASCLRCAAPAHSGDPRRGADRPGREGTARHGVGPASKPRRAVGRESRPGHDRGRRRERRRGRRGRGRTFPVRPGRIPECPSRSRLWAAFRSSWQARASCLKFTQVRPEGKTKGTPKGWEPTSMAPPPRGSNATPSW